MTSLIFFQENSAKLAGRAGNSMGFRSVDLTTVGALRIFVAEKPWFSPSDSWEFAY